MLASIRPSPKAALADQQLYVMPALSSPFRRSIRSSIVLVGTMSGFGYLLSIVRDSILARYYGRSPVLDLYFVALSPSQFVGLEAASLAYLAFLPEFSRAISGSAQDEYHHLLRRRIALAVKAGGIAGAALAVIGVFFTSMLA